MNTTCAGLQTSQSRAQARRPAETANAVKSTKSSLGSRPQACLTARKSASEGGQRPPLRSTIPTQLTIDFGKHRDQDIEDVLLNNPQYCSSLSKQEHLITDERIS
ncbi:hypothetical protein Plhal703r1_c13g0066221 [Plasmopara halstedii]